MQRKVKNVYQYHYTQSHTVTQHCFC